jgi:hypothetical protein
MSTPVTIPLASKTVQVAVAQSTKADNQQFSRATDKNTLTQQRINRNHQDHLDALGVSLNDLLSYLDGLITSGAITPAATTIIVAHA